MHSWSTPGVRPLARGTARAPPPSGTASGRRVTCAPSGSGAPGGGDQRTWARVTRDHGSVAAAAAATVWPGSRRGGVRRRAGAPCCAREPSAAPQRVRRPAGLGSGLGLRLGLGPLTLDATPNPSPAPSPNHTPDHIEEELVEARTARAADDLRERRELMRVQRARPSTAASRRTWLGLGVG